MLGALRRKARQVAGDPVLRRWLIARGTGRERGAPSFTPHRPGYLSGDLPDFSPDGVTLDLTSCNLPLPVEPLTLSLPGHETTVAADAPGALFDQTFPETESLLAAHRFAWVPLQAANGSLDPAWVAHLWAAWCDAHAAPDAGWAWHPYTAAERAINLLDFARRHGLPGPRDASLRLLALHAGAIAERLEFFGDHYTSNHLSNNGRGLFALGLALGREDWADLGAHILMAEAGRIFRRSGVLREGSTHYHLLLTRNYLDAFIRARRHDRGEASTFEEVARQALGIMPAFDLPGGLPLIGDISPDAPPDFLHGLLPSGNATTGWLATLNDEDRAAVRRVMDSARPVSPDRLAEDGWHRVDVGRWSMLTFVSPEGWPPMPGHAHQDMASAEIHLDDRVLLCDPGRGGYGDAGEAAEYVSATVHNGIRIDGADPYPVNRPYYSDRFRARVGGDVPATERHRDGLELSFGGFGRLKGIGRVTRRWSMEGNCLEIHDRLDGRGTHTVDRLLHTPFPVSVEDGAAIVDLGDECVRIAGETAPEIEETRRWTAYGVPAPAWQIRFSDRVDLPADLKIRVEAA